MKTTLHRNILIIIFCIVSVFNYGQSDTTISESLTSLTDSLIKIEIGSFTQKGKYLFQTDTLIKTVLREIPIRNCSESEVNLSYRSTYIHLFFKDDILNKTKTLDSIFLVTHSHYWVEIPENAYKGLSHAYSCNFNGNGKMDEFYSQNYKAFYSEDKKRLYIYMIGGTETNKYEVTWVIINDKYITRILDKVPKI